MDGESEAALVNAWATSVRAGLQASEVALLRADGGGDGACRAATRAREPAAVSGSPSGLLCAVQRTPPAARGSKEARRAAAGCLQQRGGAHAPARARLELRARVLRGYTYASHAGFAAYLDMWRSRGLAGTPCTSVWTVGAIAYRCRTCQARTSAVAASGRVVGEAPAR
jgi:hypothetical protein